MRMTVPLTIASLALFSPQAYAENMFGCEINKGQHDQAYELMQRQIGIGEEIGQKRIQTSQQLKGDTSLYTRLCKLRDEIFSHTLQYGIEGKMDYRKPGTCSSVYGQHKALGSAILPSITGGGQQTITFFAHPQKGNNADIALLAMRHCKGSNI